MVLARKAYTVQQKQIFWITIFVTNLEEMEVLVGLVLETIPETCTHGIIPV